MRTLTALGLLALALTGCRKEDPVDLDGDGSTSAVDCDDLDASVFPDAPEVCDGVDNDCDGEIDEEAVDAPTWYADADADGYGDLSAPRVACTQPDDHVTDSTDCDDADPATHPSAPEIDCTDPHDYNCDGSVGYADADADGVAACEECDDSRDDVYPGADELCDETDNDCDGAVDEDPVGAPTWYLDADHDGYGDGERPVDACAAPDGYVDDATDCNDLDGSTWPGAPQLCDGVANDCDAPLPDDEADADADGRMGCEGDCDDASASVYPGAVEVCDGLDNDCSGAADDGAVDASLWFADTDDDGYGDPSSSQRACDAPAHHVPDNQDCDDAHATVHPGADELCSDTLDNDCDGEVNEDSAVDTSPWYLDSDADGHGRAGAGRDACVAPAGYVATADDCDDLDPDTYPGATEVCDGALNDCDGTLPADESDTDGDGFLACDDDCDDAVPTVHPGAPEHCDDVDEDCDGAVDEDAVDPDTWYLDADGDGHGRPGAGWAACEQPDGYAATADDCDDLSASTWPGAPEACDGVLNDCDGTLPADESDTDGDGYLACDDDCDDTTATIHPGADEHCDGVDEDCDGTADEGAIDPSPWYLDADGDGYGLTPFVRDACTAPAGYTALDGDCDDTDPYMSPGWDEVPGNGVDDNCDGASADLLLFAVARNTGELWALDPDTGAVRWTVNGLGELIDTAWDPSGTVYVSDFAGGRVIAVDAATQVATPVATGLSGVHGLWWDHATSTLVVTTIDGVIAEYDPASGTTTVLHSGLTGQPIHTVRIDGVLTTSFRSAQVVRVYDGAGWSDLATAVWGPNILVPTADGWWVGGGPSGRLMHVETSGRVNSTPMGATIYGLCADPRAHGTLYFGDHDDAVRSAVAGSWGNSVLQSGLSEPWSCTTSAIPDMDQDGYAARELGGDDCDDTDRSVHPGAADAWGDHLDANCDLSDGTDLDGDGFASDDPDTYCADPDDSSAAAVPESCVLPSCSDHLATRGAGAPDGVYRIDPDGTGPIPELPLWCDMTRDGGGWTLIGKTWAGDWTDLSDQDYIALIANPVEHAEADSLRDDSMPGVARQIAFLDRAFTDALYDASAVQVTRVDLVSGYASTGPYYQRRLGAPSGWEYWHAIRDSRLWGSGTHSTSYISGDGTEWKLGFANYEPTTDDFTHMGDGSFGWWSDDDLPLNDGTDLSVSRHMGLLCDGYHNEGNQWLLTADRYESGARWKADVNENRALIWLK